MRSVTGIELGQDSCVLVRTRPARAGTEVSVVYGVRPGEGTLPDVDRADHLRRLRRKGRFPRRARVVGWSLHEGATPSDPLTRAALAPLLEAGFVLDAVLTPPEALAVLARTRPRAAGRGATAWLSLNRHAAAIAIVDGGNLLFSRVFNWNYRASATLREELLQRYSLVAHLAPELRHGFDVVRAEHGVAVDGIVTCGDLPDLRSLTMPLIEELDMEVETLDSLEGLAVVGAAQSEEVSDRAPALRLACAAAAGGTAERRPAPMRLGMAAAAALVATLAVWSVWWYQSGGEPRAQRETRPAATVAAVPPAAQRQPSGDRAPAPPATSPAAPARPSTPTVVQPRPEDASPYRLPAPAAAPVERGGAGDAGSVPAATTGQRGSPPPAAVPDPPTQPTQPPARPAAPAASPPAASRPSAATPPPSAATSPPPATPPAAAPPDRPVQPRASRPARRPVPLSAPLPVVNSILVAPDRRLAVVDGVIVREGDRIGPRVLARIEPAALILQEPSGHEVQVPIRRRLGGGR